MIGVPLSMVSLFIPIAAGYVCRFTQLGKGHVWRLALTHLAASQLLSYLWTLLAVPFARALSYIPQLHGIDKQFAPQAWIEYFVGSLLYVFSIALHYVLMAQDAARAVEVQAMETSVLAREAELRALRAQINPHFLFNSLNSIKCALTSIDGSARRKCAVAGRFFGLPRHGRKIHYRVFESSSCWTKFLAIEKVRFGEKRLRMEQSISDEGQTLRDSAAAIAAVGRKVCSQPRHCVDGERRIDSHGSTGATRAFGNCSGE